MSTRMFKQTSDINVWAAVNNDAMHPLMANQQIIINANSNNPPTVKAYTKFYVYGTDTQTSPTSPATQNNVYPANTSLTYLMSDVIFELADQTFAWNTAASSTSAGIPTKSNSTVYYLFCVGSQDIDATSRGKGKYGVSTNAPAWSNLKQGWYSSDGLVIARFYSNSSGTIINIVPITSQLLTLPIVADTAQTTLDTGAAAFSLVNNGYKMRITIDGLCAATGLLYLYWNNDTTSTHYYKEYMGCSGSTVAAGGANDSQIGSLTNAIYFSAAIDVSYIPSIQYTLSKVLIIQLNSNGVINIFSHSFSTASADITQANITSAGASGLGIGTIMKLWRW